ncbi:MAG: PEGA domain-containing protein, partial [Deltaproteobacteria bacterium]|nr:PEGA domain-containing protein [Deltaproteobacteria bacterium]
TAQRKSYKKDWQLFLMMKIKQNHIKLVLLTFSVMMFLAANSHAQSSNTGIINIKSTPEGALVFIDGKMTGTTPLITEVAASKHTIRLEQQGYENYEFKITIKKDKVASKDINLKKITKKPGNLEINNDIQIYKPEQSSKPGVVFIVTTPPGMYAFIDGFAITKQTPVAFDIKPGIYTLVLKNSKNQIVYQKTIFVKAGETLPLEIVIHKKRKIDYTDPWN